MARDVPEIKIPITPGKVRNGIEEIVERLHPRPRGVDCLPVHDLEQDLTAYASELVQAAYNDAGRDIERLRADNERLTRDNERLSRGLAAAKAKLWQAALVKCWTNEDGKRFVFVADLQDAIGAPREDHGTTRG